MALSLIAFDTDHIKSYVFGTDKLKEIRGASSILDRLNRSDMKDVADKNHIEAHLIYTNGGSGLFLVDTERAKEFGERVQQRYREKTSAGASVTFALQELPDHIKNSSVDKIMAEDLGETLELLRYKLRIAKNHTPDFITLPSHPFIRPCSSCGMVYAEEPSEDPAEPDALYCASCQTKHAEDVDVRKRIPGMIRRIIRREPLPNEYLWDRILYYLDEAKYTVLPNTERPADFNEFRQFTEAKEYLGLIYADANNMGLQIENYRELSKVKEFAETVDISVHRAMSLAIKEHLPVEKPEKDDSLPLFPFDILLVGGDDIMLVTDAAKAMDVALSIAREFRRLTKNQYTLSVGVILAPIKYPFGLLLKMAETTLKFAKKAGADDRTRTKQEGVKEFDDTRINFLTVAGSSRNDFNAVYNSVYYTKDKDKNEEFYASLRPYDTDKLASLLDAIRQGHALNLGRTKLHQVREAILKKNLTTSVIEGLTVLRNWREKQRDDVMKQVYSMARRYQSARSNQQDPGSLFPRVIFPWFADGKKEGRSVYRTSLLDFVELYNFVSREGLDESDES